MLQGSKRLKAIEWSVQVQRSTVQPSGLSIIGSGSDVWPPTSSSFPQLSVTPLMYEKLKGVWASRRG